MTVTELIEKLMRLNMNAEVKMKLVDGIVPVDDVEETEDVGVINLVC